MKKKIITLSTFIAIFTITMFVLIYLCFFADKQFLDLGYSNQDIKLFHKYQIENKITKYNNIVDSSYYCKLQKYPQPKLKQHPTPKPIDLIEKYIILSTKENDIVLDLFMGSGTTGVACVNTNRNFIGIELDQRYFEIAKERIYKAQHEDKGE